MKKLATLCMAALLALSLLVGCGSSGGSSSAPATSGTGSGSAPASAGIQVAAIFAGAINDGNWNQTQYEGLLRLEALGAEIGYMENISDTDAAEAARSYASMGYDIVYLSTNSFQDYCSPIAEDFPDTIFIQINGTIITDNFISVRVADEEQGFLQGAAAALLSTSGKVGFIGGLEINPIILGSSGFQQGVDYVNKTYNLNVEANRINTGSFSDVNKAKETTLSFIESGCDVIAPMADDASVGIMEAAEGKGIAAVASGAGLKDSAPTATKLAVIKDNSVIYDATYDAYLKGTLVTTQVETYGAAKGVIYLVDWSDDVPEDVKTKVEDILSKIKSGDIVISTDV